MGIDKYMQEEKRLERRRSGGGDGRGTKEAAKKT